LPLGSPTVTAATTTATATAAATTTVTTAIAAAAEATAATTTTATRTALLRDIDAERTAFEVLTVEVRQRLLSAFLRRHLDEAEAARAAGHPVKHQSNLADLATGGEALRNQIFSRVKREVANIQTIRHFGHFSLAASTHTNPAHSRNEGEVHIALYENAGRV
jgi:hypothetical protein